MQAAPYSELSPLDLMKLCLWRKARGEGMLGKRGVAHVIQNRADDPSWWGHDVHSVILKPGNFRALMPLIRTPASGLRRAIRHFRIA
jgi:hypothetical protein